MTMAATAVGVGGSILGGIFGNSAKKKAAAQAQAAQDRALAEQKAAFAQARAQNVPLIDTATRQAMGYVSPYADAGANANYVLQQKMGLTPDANGKYSDDLTRNFNAQDYRNDPGYTPMTSNQFTRDQYGQMQGVPKLVSNTLSADEWKNDGTGTYTATPRTLEELQATPGYQFQLAQGLQSVNNSAAAKGSLMSGATMKSLNNYAQGQASTGFADAWNRGQEAYQNAFARKQDQFTQGQQGYQQAFNNNQTQYQQGQNALQSAYDRFGNNQQNTYNRLAGQQNTGYNAADRMGQYATTGANNIAQQNSNYANSLGNVSQNYADNTANVADYRGTNQANMYGKIGSSITDLAGKYLESKKNA